MFSDETLASQLYAFCRHVRRPLKQRDNPHYIVPTVKNASTVMIWAAMKWSMVYARRHKHQWNSVA